MSGEIGLDFDRGFLILLNFVMAFMIFGVSLTLKVEDFRRVAAEPKAPALGLIAQFLFLPALTTLGTWIFDIRPELALGMILVASCPGGAFSNVMTWIARGNVALSIGMTAVSSLAATVLTPLNFALYAALNPRTRTLFREIAVSPGEVLGLVVLVLGLPLILGMTVGQRFPEFGVRSERPLRITSLLIFITFIGIAFAANFGIFIEYFGTFFWLVVIQNTGALLLGQGLARLGRLAEADRRAVTLEVGIQNSGLALVILFTYLPEAGGMMLIAAFWGVWHLVSGLTLSSHWARRPVFEGREMTSPLQTSSPAA